MIPDKMICEDKTYKRGVDLLADHILTVIITRFDMRLPFHDMSIDLHEEYIGRRLELFEAICLPSVNGQSALPDHWLVGLDSGRAKNVERVVDLLGQQGCAAPVWQQFEADQHEPASATFRREIMKRILPKHTHVMTIRLDNDDALSGHYVISAQRYASSILNGRPDVEDFWLSFPLGAQLASRSCSLRIRNDNPFLTRCVSTNYFLSNTHASALDLRHTRLFQSENVYLVMTRKPMWLQAVHGGNVRNTFDKSLSLKKAANVMSLFNIDRDVVFGVLRSGAA